MRALGKDGAKIHGRTGQAEAELSAFACIGAATDRQPVSSIWVWSININGALQKLAAPWRLAPLPFATKNIHPMALAASRLMPTLRKLFINFVLSEETQDYGAEVSAALVSRADIAQDEINKFKVVVEEIELADRMNEIVADYEKYLE